MPYLQAISLILAVFAFPCVSVAWNNASPSKYGRVIIKKHSERAGLAPVIFDHWVHRSRFTCRLCHVDIGFAMEANGTNITASMNRQGYYCGSCHDGKRSFNGKITFQACSGGASKEASVHCDRCHSLGKNVVREYEFADFANKMPKAYTGNGINWEAAEEQGLIKLVDFLDGISTQRASLKMQKDFSLEVKASWVGEVKFSHKKHAIWNGCEVCHPEIFPSVQKGRTKFNMFQISDGQFCGVCHEKVAFSLKACEGCHISPVGIGR